MGAASTGGMQPWGDVQQTGRPRRQEWGAGLSQEPQQGQWQGPRLSSECPPPWAELPEQAGKG